MTDERSSPPQAEATLQLENDTVLRCRGVWALPHLAPLEKRLAKYSWPQANDLELDAGAIERMDTAGAWLLQRTLQHLHSQGKQVRLNALDAEQAAVLKMVSTEELETSPCLSPPACGPLAQLGRFTWQGIEQGLDFMAFVGESTLTSLSLMLRPHQMRWRVLFSNVQTTGFSAVPIIGLLSFLLGVVIAYQAAVQLQAFGANIFIVDLVGISILREIAPLMTAVIVAGRSGSAYTAQIGTMQVTQEVDALRTIGIAPLELLVVPKVFALVLALPLLTVFADIVGVCGGAIVASQQLGISLGVFAERFPEAVSLANLLIGIGKAPLFACIIALVGCYRGFQVSGTADSVGRQTTLSVVQSIFLVIVVDAFLSVVFSQIGLGL